MIYFAAGWFSEKQNKLYDKITKILKEDFGELEFFIPRDLGINLMKKTPEERKLLTKKVFALDIGFLLVTAKTDGFVLAVVDDYDVGMVWECGFIFGTTLGKTPIITYTDKDYGVNAMLRESAAAHIRGEDMLKRFLHRYREGGANTPALLKIVKYYQNFSEKVF